MPTRQRKRESRRTLRAPGTASSASSLLRSPVIHESSHRRWALFYPTICMESQLNKIWIFLGWNGWNHCQQWLSHSWIYNSFTLWEPSGHVIFSNEHLFWPLVLPKLLKFIHSSPKTPNTSFETPDKIICLCIVLTIDRRPTSFKFCQPLPQNHNPYAKLRSQQSCDMRQALKGCGYAWNLAAAWCNYHQTNLSLYHVIPGRKKQPQFDYQLLPVLLVEVHISFWFSFLAHTPEL